jgi:hypothetical protein
MIAMTCIASLLLQIVAPLPRSGIPPDALPEVAEEHPLSTPVERWSAQAFAAWGGPWDLRPSLYDYRYVTW